MATEFYAHIRKLTYLVDEVRRNTQSKNRQKVHNLVDFRGRDTHLCKAAQDLICHQVHLGCILQQNTSVYAHVTVIQKYHCPVNPKGERCSMTKTSTKIPYYFQRYVTQNVQLSICLKSMRAIFSTLCKTKIQL